MRKSSREIRVEKIIKTFRSGDGLGELKAEKNVHNISVGDVKRYLNRRYGKFGKTDKD